MHHATIKNGNNLAYFRILLKNVVRDQISSVLFLKKFYNTHCGIKQDNSSEQSHPIVKTFALKVFDLP